MGKRYYANVSFNIWWFKYFSAQLAQEGMKVTINTLSEHTRSVNSGIGKARQLTLTGAKRKNKCRGKAIKL